MAKALPYFRWFPSDADSDELYSSLDDRELGFYHRLLNKSWNNSGLPPDLNELAAVMKVKRAYLDKLWAKVGKCFVETDTVRPRLVNPRQEKERLYATSKSERATNSVRSRYERRSNVDTRASESESESLSKNSEGVGIPKKRGVAAPDWEALNAGWKWLEENYAGDVNEHVDLQLFLSVMETPEDLAMMRENVPLWNAARSAGYHKTATKFLSERVFKTKPKSRDDAGGRTPTVRPQRPPTPASEMGWDGVVDVQK